MAPAASAYAVVLGALAVRFSDGSDPAVRRSACGEPFALTQEFCVSRQAIQSRSLDRS
jgi:hypothetical protein